MNQLLQGTTTLPMQWLDDAIVAPMSKWRMHQGDLPGSFDGGVYTADGAIADCALQIKKHYENVPQPLPELPGTALPGSHLYGGLLQNGHFGHFMVESLTRLWAARHIPELQTVVFILRNPGKPIPSFVSSMLRLLKIDLPITAVTVPERFAQLAVPAQALVPGLLMLGGAPEVREMVAHLCGIVGTNGARRLYVSRSRLRPSFGGLLFESRLENHLREQGYTILHPEEHSLEEQIKFYVAAEELIFAEGSAIHMYALVARPEQRAFVVWRRKARVAFDLQLASFGAAPMMGKAALKTIWVPNLQRGAINRTQAVLDFAGLHAQLAAAGFVDGPSWEEPTSAESAAELARISALVNLQYVEQEP